MRSQYSSWYNPDRPEDRRHHFVRRRLQQTFKHECTLRLVRRKTSLFPYNFTGCTRYGIHQGVGQGQFLFENCLKVTAVVFNSCVTLSSSLWYLSRPCVGT
jgi:hypothetical protein